MTIDNYQDDLISQNLDVKDRRVIGIALAVIAIFLAIDIISDAYEGAPAWHLGVEATVVIAALYGLKRILRRNQILAKAVRQKDKDLAALNAEASRWRQQAQAHLKGLASAVDAQLEAWKLSHAEKEIAFLLIKGHSLKDIAALRNTSEQTARKQALSIYEKSGLSGRAELAAFFLEDFLAPQ